MPGWYAIKGMLGGEWVWGTALIGSAMAGVLLLGVLRLSLVEAAVVATLLVHFSYYTFVIGGDHFEWRVYCHLILLVFVSLVWLLDKAGTRAVVALPGLLLPGAQALSSTAGTGAAGTGTWAGDAGQGLPGRS